MSTSTGIDGRVQPAGLEGGSHGIAPGGYRLPAATRPGRVKLQVSDLERSLEYYEGLLGFRVLNRSADHAALAPRDDDTVLIELHERKGANPVPGGGRPGLYHFAILLPDRASLARFVLHLGETGTRAGASDHLVSEALYLQDPDGLGIEVYADRPRSEWRYEGGQLVMTTAPLDMEDLLDEMRSEAWAGMPAGTVIGHVHLHVGDIDRAAELYHEGLGLDKIVWNYPGALFLSAGGYHHHLGLNTWAARAEPAGEGDAKLLEWELVLPSAADVRDALGSLEAAGNEVERTPDGGLISDPWGTTLRVTHAASS